MKYLKSGFWALALSTSLLLASAAFADQLFYTPEIPTPVPSVFPSPSPTPSNTPSVDTSTNSTPSDVDMRRYIGVFGGLDLSSVEHNDPGTNHRNGFQFGADFETPIFIWLWFQPEIKYVQKGYGVSSSPIGYPVNATVPFNYLELPLHAKVKLAQGTVAPFGIFGPSFARKLSGGNSDIGDGESLGTNLRNWDISFDIGIGTDVQVSKNTRIFVSFEYSAGLLTVIPNTDQGNRNMQLILGYNFAL
jgi:hypothetical protein